MLRGRNGKGRAGRRQRYAITALFNCRLRVLLPMRIMRRRWLEVGIRQWYSSHAILTQVDDDVAPRSVQQVAPHADAVHLKTY
jgi:hypothetical protein